MADFDMKDFNGDPVALELVKAKRTIDTMRAALRIIAHRKCATLRKCDHSTIPSLVCPACAEFACGPNTAPKDICGPCLAAVTLSIEC